MTTLWIINEYAGSPYHGMEYRHYYLGKELLKHNYCVYIITASFSHLFKNKPDVKKRFHLENIDGINYLWIKVPEYSSSQSKGRVFKWFIYTLSLFFLPLKKLSRPDYILLSPMQTLPIFPALFLSKKYNAKLLFEVKDIWPLSIIELGSYSRNNLFVRLLKYCEKLALRKSNLIISVLPNYQEYLINGKINKNFYYLPNGVSLDEYKKVEPLNFNLKEVIGDNFCIAYTGTIGLANALEAFVEAAKILKNYNITFLIVGDGDYKEHLIKISKGYDNVKFLPPISKHQVPSLLAYVDACYIGLRKKNLFKYGVSPNKLFDYMISGKPVVFAIDTKNSVVEQAKCGFVAEAENPQDIANAILKVYNLTEEERNRIKKASINFIIENHTYEKISLKLIKLLEEL